MTRRHRHARPRNTATSIVSGDLAAQHTAVAQRIPTVVGNTADLCLCRRTSILRCVLSCWALSVLVSGTPQRRETLQ